jgi:transcriptional regulator with XRE-family HTH domain
MSDSRVVEADGARVIELRKKKGWTQQDLANECADLREINQTLNASLGTIRNIEHGGKAFPSSVRCVAQALRVSYETIVKQSTVSGTPAPEVATATQGDAIVQLLIQAQQELSWERTSRILVDALRAAETWNDPGAGDEPILLWGQAMAGLITEDQDSKSRTKSWRKLLSKLKVVCGVAMSPFLAEAFAIHATRASGDAFSDFPLMDRRRFLIDARNVLQDAIEQLKDGEDKLENEATLFARKSSVLRHLAALRDTPSEELDDLRGSLKCSKLAKERYSDGAILLQEALAEWAVAKSLRDDEMYAQTMRRVEKLLTSDEVLGLEEGRLTLARFYRLNHQPWDACRAYRAYSRRARNRRRMLRESYICGEAAAQMWYGGYPRPMVNECCDEALMLLEQAFAAGYHSARLITALAFLHAATSGDVEVGEAAMSRIYVRNGGVDWDQTARNIAKANIGDLGSYGFAMGINNSGVLTRLGTFAREFSRNDELAEALYRLAVAVNGRDVVALTNVARFLIARGRPEDLIEARQFLGRAQVFAEPRFKWWRAVLAELDNRYDAAEWIRKAVPSVESDDTQTYSPLKSFRAVKSRFKRIQRIPISERRSFEMIRLMYDVANLNFGIENSTYQIIERPEGYGIEGAFRHRGEPYIIGCQWNERLVEPDIIATFGASLGQGQYGLFIACAGYSEGAIAAANELNSSTALLLMDGAETNAIIRGHINFDELVLRKRLFRERMGICYQALHAASAVV